mmetsp:Transcript_18003/g.56464  ORF Transcript_18003/g.56464 Transcript_18003/m.56464 type:complete len:216 (+) Transcript_18003:528-1175(+)
MRTPRKGSATYVACGGSRRECGGREQRQARGGQRHDRGRQIYYRDYSYYHYDKATGRLAPRRTAPTTRARGSRGLSEEERRRGGRVSLPHSVDLPRERERASEGRARRRRRSELELGDVVDGGLEGGDVVAGLGELLVRVAEGAEDSLEVGEVWNVRVDEDVDEDGEKIVGAEVGAGARVLGEEELGDLLGGGEEGVELVAGQGVAADVGELVDG